MAARLPPRTVSRMPTTARARPLRSLADDLRSRSDADLASVIRMRPDTADPVPIDIAELAARASSSTSIRTALDELDRPRVGLLAALASQPQPAAPAKLPEAGSEPELLLELVRDLWSRALLWGLSPDSLDAPVHVASAVRETITEVTDGPLQLARLEPVAAEEFDSDDVDQMAGQHALAALTVVCQLADSWALRPPSALKAGGLGVRELTATAVALQTDELTAAFWIELAYAAGLVGVDDHAQRCFAPTNAYDGWASADLADQWARLASAWLSSERDSSSVGSETADHQRLATLGTGLEAPGLARLREATLGILADASPGSGVAPDEVEAVLADRLPRVATVTRSRFARSTLRQAELLGVTARGALSAMGRTLLSTGSAVGRVAAAAREVMPTPTEEFLAQADLTLVVPGPPSPPLRALLNLVADVESTGGAAVYRVTPASIARILDTGRTPADVLQELAARSVTPLPQPLEYLVNDIARRHGTVRIGAVSSYIRSDDESVIAALLAHPRARALGLVQVAPTVVVSRATGDALLEVARELGHAPVAEGADGSVVAVPRVLHRAPDLPNPVSRSARGLGFDEVFVVALVRALRNTEADSGINVALIDSSNPLPRMATAQSATVLRAAHEGGHPVWIGYADNAGSTTRRLVDIVAMDAGAISAFDHNLGRIRTLALSRVTGVQRAVVTDEPGQQASD